MITLQDAKGINGFFIRSLDEGGIGAQQMIADIETIREIKGLSDDQRFDSITETIIEGQKYLSAVIEARYIVRDNKESVSTEDYE